MYVKKAYDTVLVGVAAAGGMIHGQLWTGECGWKMGISIIFIYVVPTGILRLPLALWSAMTRDKVPDYVVTLPDISVFYNKPQGCWPALCRWLRFSIAALCYRGRDVLNLVSGIPIWLAMAIAGGVIIVYTALAGLWGLAVTDLIQFAVMTVSAGALLLGIMNETGGLAPVYEAIAARDPNLITPMGNLTILSAVGWIISAAALYVNAQSYQRFGAAKSGGDIKVAYSLMLSIGILFSMVMVFSGMAASVLHPNAPTISQGFWATVFTVLPPGARGLFVAALIAAVMSTVSADILITGGILIKDIYKDVFKPDLSDRSVIKGRGS